MYIYLFGICIHVVITINNFYKILKNYHSTTSIIKIKPIYITYKLNKEREIIIEPFEVETLSAVIS